MTNYPTLAKLMLVSLTTLAAAASAAGADYFIYYGSPNGGTGKGVSLGHFNSATGALTKPDLAAPADGAGFFTFSADGKHFYTAYALKDTLAAYERDPKTGALKLLNTKPTDGGDPCHVSLDKTGHYLLVANYAGGNADIYALQPDGSLGNRTAQIQLTGSSIDPVRQTKSYGHCIITDPTNHFVLVADLGSDKVAIYKFNEKDGTVTPNTPAFGTLKPGTGPRHLLFSPNGKVLYVIGEMGGTITAFNWDATKGSLTEFQNISTLPADFKGTNTDAELMIHPNGKFLYASARGHDSIAVFSIDPASGKLALVQDVPMRGKTPRYFTFDPTGKWIVAGSQGDNNAAVFSVDDKTGKMTPVGDPITVDAPICIGFQPVP